LNKVITLLLNKKNRNFFFLRNSLFEIMNKVITLLLNKKRKLSFLKNSSFEMELK